ncbi:MAG: GTPase HflX, partial [Candidatus Dormibacteraeota bacterium]|nr:GTPase HflX [Candidatus Dormibacteraeota bacterium]
PSGRRVIVTDTVGFIQNLPTELVEAFAATLEEVRQAHMLAIVVDASHPDCEAQLATVLETLADMGCDQPALLVLNKADRLSAREQRARRLTLGDVSGMSPLCISALRESGLRELRQAFDSMAARVVPETRANRQRRDAASGDSVPERAAG